MRKGGIPGMGGGMNINKLMKEAKKMQRELEEKQENLATTIFEARSGGGMVFVKVNGNKEILELKIDKEAVDPEDVETLEDLILVALKDVFSKVDEEVQGSMGNMNIPGF